MKKSTNIGHRGAAWRCGRASWGCAGADLTGTPSRSFWICDSITRLGGHAFVFVATPADQGDIAKQRPVELGELTNNAYVVAKGLAAGDRVITSNVQKLHDGAPVAPAKH